MKSKDLFVVLFVAAMLPIDNFCEAQIPATAKEEIFKDWNYSPAGVFGLHKLVKPEQRSYYKIFKPNNETVKVQSYNSSGIVTSTTLIRFVNGKINQVATTNRWGETTDITKYAATTVPGEFIVTSKNRGRNSYLPCKGAKYIYRNNLLSEIRYISYTNTVSANASGVAIIKYKRYTDKNRYSLLNEMTFYDAGGMPVISTSYDCHKVVYEYDQRCNQVSVSYFGTDNEPLTNRYGGFKTKYVYDENDKTVSSEVIGINDEVTKNAYGVAKTGYEYKNGLTWKSTRYDEKGNIARAAEAGDGVAIIQYEYDANGNEISRSYYDEKNNPMNNFSGIHRINYSYDPLDMLTSLANYDKYGSPVNNKSGIHKYLYVRDDKGRIIQQSYYDSKNNPVKDNTNEVYMVKYKYDEQGRDISESFWENSTTKMNRWNGYHENITKYNEDGQEVELIMLDMKGNQVNSKSGYSRIITVYDAQARVAEFRYYSNNNPINMDSSFANRFHSVKFYYDGSGRKSSLRYFDKTGQPVEAFIDMEESFYCHKIEFIYKGNSLIEERLYKLGNDAPSKIIDCLKNDYIATNGVSKGYKNR